MFVGFLLVLLGIFVIMVAGIYYAYRQASQANQSRAEVGGVVMIGPIPIVFGTSWKMAVIAMVLAAVLIVLAIAMMLLLRAAAPAPATQAPASALAALLAPA